MTVLSEAIGFIFAREDNRVGTTVIWNYIFSGFGLIYD